MRMICPNCEAQYEVDANVIPETGRDVQCSNCGHTWFQRRSELEDDRAPQPAGLLQPEPEPEPEPEPAPVPEPEAEPTPEFDVAEFYASVPEPKPEPEITIETPDEPVAPAPDETNETNDETPVSAQDDYSQAQQSDTPHHQPLGEDVVEILREEAERETAERSFGEHDFSVQPSSDLDQAEPHPEPNPEPHNQEQTTGLLGQDPEPAPEIAAQPHEAKNKRRNLLPDIEEIKSTLSATKGDVAIDDSASAEQRRSGFRRGFVSAISVFALLALLYVFAGKITAAIPQTETFLSGYVAWIDGLRTTVDRVMLSAVERLTGLLAQLGSDTGA